MCMVLLCYILVYQHTVSKYFAHKRGICILVLQGNINTSDTANLWEKKQGLGSFQTTAKLFFCCFLIDSRTFLPFWGYSSTR